MSRMTRIILDTDVASLAFKRRLPPTLAARLAGRATCITFATLADDSMGGGPTLGATQP